VPPSANPAALRRLLAPFFVLAILAGAWQPATAAPAPLAGRAYELADAAYKALETKDLERAFALSSEALAIEPGHPSLLVLQADVLDRQERHAEAYERLRGLAPADLGANGLAQRGYIALKLRNRDAAEADFAAALKAGGLSAEARSNVASELAYLALARKDDAAAERWFRVALEGRGPGASRGSLYADAGYTAMRRADNDTAVALLSRAVDEWHAAPPGQKPFDEQSLYGMRRSVDSLSRMFGATFSVGHGSVASGSTLAPGALGVLQAGAEVFFRPPGIGYRDGRIFEIYANGFQALDAEERDFPTGSESRVAGVGLRYKPLRDHNVILALEYRAAIGDRAGEDDWLLRAGWSASRGTDWEPVRASWFTWQAYTETVYFTRAERWVQPFEARAGYSWKLSPSPATVLTPFVGIGGEFDDALSEKWAAGIGPGIAVRHWFRDKRHRAYASYVDFSLQYRFRVSEAQRGEGWFGLLAITF
jgi:cellulose synthase operon protein C